MVPFVLDGSAGERVAGMPGRLCAMQECKHPGCEKPRESASRSAWCAGHRARRKSGRDMDAPWQEHQRGLSSYELVMRTVRPDGDCLIFEGFIARNGYGRVETKIDGPISAHRAVAAHAFGASPLPVLHSCDRPTCVNPKHLRYGTHGENGRDKAERERAPRGTMHANAILSEADVRAIRLDPRPSSAVALDFGCAARTVRNIRARATWAWLE